MKIYKLVYCRPLNKLIEYYYKDFDDGASNKAILTIAKFKDKSNNIKEYVARVKWEL